MDRIEAWSRELFSFDVRPFLEERVFAPGEFILREGSFLNFPAAPDLIGDMELLEVRRESLCVQALTRCHFWVVDSRRCLPQLREDPKFLWFLCNHIARRSARQSTVLTIQQAYPPGGAGIPHPGPGGPGSPGGGVRKNARYLPSCPCFFGGLWCIIRIFYGLR